MTVNSMKLISEKKMGFNEDETNEIIVQLLSEHKIEYRENKACNYSTMKRGRKKNNSR